MNTPKRSAGRRLVAALGVAALSLAGAVGIATAANAAVGPDQPSAPTTGTLTINKYSGSPTASPSPDSLLNGVEFTVTQVGRLSDSDVCSAIDLTKAADWAGLDGTNGLFNSAPTAPTSPFCLMSGTSYVHVGTTANGQITFNLNVGVYFVQETGSGGNNIVSSVPNFYVSIPTSDNSASGGWNYNVVADPKNQIMGTPSKTIADDPDGLVVGSDVIWTLTVPVPTLNNNETFTNAVITDTLDSRLTYVSQSSVVKVGSIDLVDGTDYNVTGNAVWTLTPAGRTVLDENMGKDLTIEFKTAVVSVGSGSIPNNTYKSTFNGTTVPGEVVPYTYWGKLAINKTDDSANKNPLQGAEFQVFEKTAGATCGAEAPANGQIATGTSDANGVVQWAGVTPTNELGLWVKNSSNGPLTNPTKDYCVYETKIPAGHSATQISNPVTISASATAVTLNVVNPKTPGPNLPLTGANGQLLALIGGGSLVLLAAGTALVARKRSHQD